MTAQTIVGIVASLVVAYLFNSYNLQLSDNISSDEAELNLSIFATPLDRVGPNVLTPLNTESGELDSSSNGGNIFPEEYFVPPPNNIRPPPYNPRFIFNS